MGRKRAGMHRSLFRLCWRRFLVTYVCILYPFVNET